MNYRKKFKEYYGIEFSSDFEVHHIDLNRENNDISNLMILPKKLHHQYHMYLNGTAKANDDVFKRSFSAKIHSNEAGVSYEQIMFEGLIETLKECAKWADYKMYLDGKLPNIHNIALRGDLSCL